VGSENSMRAITWAIIISPKYTALSQQQQQPRWREREEHIYYCRRKLWHSKAVKSQNKNAISGGWR